MPKPSKKIKSAMRGRKPLVMTARRRQVLAVLVIAARRGDGPPSLWRIARECGLYDHSSAARILKDLRRIAAINNTSPPARHSTILKPISSGTGGSYDERANRSLGATGEVGIIDRLSNRLTAVSASYAA